MHAPPDIKWVPESRLLALCRLSRSTFQSWQRSGLDLSSDSGTYGLAEVVTCAILVAAREFLSPKDMVSAWRSLVQSGEAEKMVAKARQLEAGERFDLVIEMETGSLGVATSDEALIKAVRQPTYPVPVVVVDVAERIRTVVRGFNQKGEETSKRPQRRPGRPRSAARNVISLPRSESA